MSQARNTVAYFKKEVVVGTVVVPTSTTDGFCSIEKPDVTTGQFEVLESAQLTASIGVKKPQVGMESASATVNFEMRSHGNLTNPTEPDFGAIMESAIGTPIISVADSVQALPAPSTTEFTIATEGSLKKHDFFIINNTTAKKLPRFVKSLKLAVIAGINDKIDFKEGGAELNATLTAGVFIHGGSAVIGSIGEEIKTQLESVGASNYTVSAVEQADGSYKYTIVSDGVSFSILLATGLNTADAFLKLNLGFGLVDLTGAVTYTGSSSVFGTRIVCNLAMSAAPTAADVVTASVNYRPLNEGHKHFTSGFYQGNSNTDGYLEQVVGCLVSSLGINITTGQIAKFSASLQGLNSIRTALTKTPYDPSYEDVQGLTGFNVLCYFGSVQVCANAVTVDMTNEIAEKKTFCSESGKSGSELTKRSIKGTINPYADGSTTFFDAIKLLTEYDVMIVIGVKDANGFTVGKTVGVYLPQVSIDASKTNDIDGNLINELSFSAHRGSSGSKNELCLAFA